MARKRSPERDKAFELFEKANGDIMNREIAEKLGISEKTVGGWKSKDKWLEKINGVLQSNERSTPNDEGSKVGAPFGNQNAVGNKGNKNASPPLGNKNAVVTGQYETLMFEHLDEDEKRLFLSEVDSELVLMRDIQFLRVRQVRMMKRLESLENDLNDHERTILYELRARQALVEAKGKKIKVDADEGLVKTEEQVKITPKIDTVLRFEKALNDVSAQLTRSIKQFNETQLLDNKKELMKYQVEKLKAEVEVLRGSKEGNEDATDWKSALENTMKLLEERS